jgi:hypothetical protein
MAAGVCRMPGSCCLTWVLVRRPGSAPKIPPARRVRSTSLGNPKSLFAHVTACRACRPTQRVLLDAAQFQGFFGLIRTLGDVNGPQTCQLRCVVAGSLAALLRGYDRSMGWKIVAAVAVALALAPAAPARAQSPGVGSSCVSGQLNQTTVSSAGTTVRCLADEGHGYIWKTDNGVQQAPADADRIARDACARLGHATAECSGALDRVPHQ